MYLENHPIAEILGNERVQYLRTHNMRHVEQLVALLNDDLGEHAVEELQWDDTDALKSKLNDWAKVEETTGELIAGLTSAEITESRSSLKSLNQIVVTQGVRLDVSDIGFFGEPYSNYDSLRNDRIDVYESAAIPDDQCYLFEQGSEPMALDQGSRGTCVAFAFCAAAEHLIGSDIVLSKQWAYYKAKIADSDTEHLPGTKFSVMANVCKDHGFLPEDRLRYERRIDEPQSLLFRQSPGLGNLINTAKKLRLRDYAWLKPGTIEDIRQALCDQHVVIMCVPVFRRAWLSPYVRSRGEVELPLTHPTNDTILDERIAFHAIALYGFEVERSENARAGGGFFVFRNSWGEKWGRNQAETPIGYGLLPFAYVEKYATEAMILKQIERFSDSGKRSRNYQSEKTTNVTR